MHEKQQTLNIYGPRFTFSRKELRDDETTVPNDCAVKTPKHSLLAESVDLTGGFIFKWNKRVYAEENSVLPTDAADCPKSPKLCHLRARPMSALLSPDHTLEHVPGDISKTDDVSHLRQEHAEVNSRIENITSEPPSVSIVNSVRKDESSKPHITNTPDEILFFYMGRESSQNCRILHDSSSISLSSQECRDHLESEDHVVSQHICSFNQVTKKKIWYDPPPLA
jgi:hypothetical protein